MRFESVYIGTSLIPSSLSCLAFLVSLTTTILRIGAAKQLFSVVYSIATYLLHHTKPPLRGLKASLCRHLGYLVQQNVTNFKIACILHSRVLFRRYFRLV